jgi:hypothetical protein
VSAAPSVSTAQIVAQLDAVLARDPTAAVIAIRSPGNVSWPESVARRGRSFRIRWCESKLSMREALTEIEMAGGAGDGVVLMTPMNDTELPDDVAARLARSRVFQPKGWDILRQMFDAQGTDARLGEYEWMPQVLIDSAEAGPFTSVASGFLDLETAWREVLQRYLQLTESRPDAATLMRWALRPDLPVLLGKLPPKARSDALGWLGAHAGTAGALIIQCIDAGRAADAAPLGLVCEVIFSAMDEGAPELAQAAVRMERYVGDHHVSVGDGREWAKQASRLLDHTAPDEGRAILDRADALLRELRVAEFAHRSEWLPFGLEQRFGRFAGALNAQLSQLNEATAAEVEESANGVLNHKLASLQPLRAERVRMARRLARWLLRPVVAANGLDQLVAVHADDTTFVDWARFRLLGGDELPELSTAYGALRSAVFQRRDAFNKSFAGALAIQGREAQPLGPRVLPLESVLQTLLGPLAQTQPVLLLVVDGLSVSIFRELFERPERHGWAEMLPEQGDRPLLGLAAFPTVTEVSRSSLLCGRICVGAAPSEKAGFSSHPALLAASSASHPPKLFHKGDLNDDGNLAGDVRAALSNPSQKIVGVVYNAVDDHLSGPDQLHQRWSLEDLRLFLPLLREARDSRRVVVITADHGHMLEENSVMLPGGQSDRWRVGAAAADAKEVRLTGNRVLTPDGANQVVCLWSEAGRYTGRKNGYHGGASPAEAIVPMSVFVPFGVNLAGWKPAPPQQPDWWDLPALAAVTLATAPAPRTPARRAPAVPVGQEGLFSSTDLPLPVTGTVVASTDWIAVLLTSAVYASQRQLAARVALPDDQMRKLLAALDERGGKLSRAALAQRLGVAEMRIGGVLSAARRMLNVDQAAVMTVDEASGTVEINRSLLQQQFRIAPTGGTR